ncbi:hypothetical protein [Gordonia terrae]|uniref:hypothetical protein n=1 Tax=Gordonia terrae TaxID=2055 RepID=UPI00117E7AD1|nr:hypothetical protein [Gordonia terrae]
MHQAEKEVTVAPLTFKPGRALTVIQHHEGWIGDHHFCTTQEYWYSERTTAPPRTPGRLELHHRHRRLTADLHMEFSATSNVDERIPVTTHITWFAHHIGAPPAGGDPGVQVRTGNRLPAAVAA